MSNEQARTFLDSIRGYIESGQADQLDFRMATVDPNYDLMQNYVKVIFDGEDKLNYKGFSWVAPYVPKAGDRVVLLPINNTYVILGAVSSIYTPAVQYAEFYLTQSFPASSSFVDRGGFQLSSRAVNSNFAEVGTGSVAVKILETGIYSVSMNMAPSSGPGIAGLFGRLGSTEPILASNTGDPPIMWEFAGAISAVKIDANSNIFYRLRNQNTFSGTARIRIHKIGTV